MTKEFYEKLSDLRVAQGETHTLLHKLTEKVNKYIDADDERHHDLMKFRLESSKHLSSVATIVCDLKKDMDRVVDTHIPAMQTEQASQKATLKSHNWLIRAIVGVTLIAMLGGAVTSVATCDLVSAAPESADKVTSSDASLDGP